MRACMIVMMAMMATTALAGDKKDRAEVEAQYKKVTEVDFGVLDVKGAVVRPSFGYVQPLTGLQFKSLIKPRVEWTREIKVSVDEIK